MKSNIWRIVQNEENNRRRILKINIQKIKNNFKEIYKVIPKRRDSFKENNDVNKTNKRDEEEYKELRRIIQEGLEMEDKLKSHSTMERENKLNTSDYTPNNETKLNKFSKGKKQGKSGIRDQPKTSTISFTLNMMVDEDRVKRIQSAHAMQRSKEREESVSNSISQSNLNRK